MNKDKSILNTVVRPVMKWVAGLVVAFAVLDAAHHVAQTNSTWADLLIIAGVWFFIELGLSFADHKELKEAYQSCDEKREELAQKYLTLSAQQDRKLEKSALAKTK